MRSTFRTFLFRFRLLKKSNPRVVTRLWRTGLVLLLTGILPLGAWVQNDEQSLNVAVAANFLEPMTVLSQRFEAQTGVKAIVSFGSTGTLFAQIQNGAPFDVFFAADVERPLRLEQEGKTVLDSRFTYAIGRLALWSSQSGYVDDQGEVLKSDTFRHLAIANPNTAPYGRAAQQVLERLGLWDALQEKIVRGENVTQTFQFVQTGNAKLGFAAWSSLKRPGVALDEIPGSYWLVPQELYAPIEQQAVLLSSSPNQTLGRQFVDFVRSEDARQLIEAFGYDPPSSATE